jgi:DNA polymerase-3 subunit beta
MRAKVTKKDILPAVMRAVSIADKKSVVPILSNVLLEFNESSLKIKATDLDHSVIEVIPAEVDTFGTVAVPANTLSDIVRKSEDDAVLEFSLIEKGSKLLVTVEKSKFELATLDYRDFPEIAPIRNICSISIKASDLNKLITRTKFSMSPEENRHNLNGIYFHKEESHLIAASTDGHRLSTSRIPLEVKESIQGMIISKKTVFEMKKLLDTFQKDIVVAFSINMVQFAFGDVILISKLVDGVFPDYRRVIPEMSGDFFKVNRNAFSGVIDRLSVISDDKLRSIKLELNRGTLFFNVANNRVGSGNDELSVEYSGQNWSAGFNVNYLLDVAQTLQGEMLKVYVKESLAPILIVDESEPESQFVVMPMRI